MKANLNSNFFEWFSEVGKSVWDVVQVSRVSYLNCFSFWRIPLEKRQLPWNQHYTCYWGSDQPGTFSSWRGLCNARFLILCDLFSLTQDDFYHDGISRCLAACRVFALTGCEWGEQDEICWAILRGLVSQDSNKTSASFSYCYNFEDEHPIIGKKCLIGRRTKSGYAQHSPHRTQPAFKILN